MMLRSVVAALQGRAAAAGPVLDDPVELVLDLLGPGQPPYRRFHGVLTTSAKRGAPSSHATRAPLAVKLMA